MARTQPFDTHKNQYEEWFVNHSFVFESEIAAIRKVLPRGRGVEIGVGTGLFSEKLGIRDGVEPSESMARTARERGVHVCRGVAENLPCHDGSFDFALMVTTICFVDSPEQAVREMRRVVGPQGCLVLGFVDKDSPLGRQYEEFKAQNVFYKDATFYSARDIAGILEAEGLKVTDIRQTVFGELKDVGSVQDSEEGSGRGGFVVIKAEVP